MAGSCTITRKKTRIGHAPHWFNAVEEIKWAWTSDASGNCDAQTDDIVVGRAVLLKTIPDDTDVPSNLYDVTITDEDGIDILDDVGAERSDSTPEMENPGASTMVEQPFINQKLQLNISNAGNAKKGVVKLLISAI